MLGKGLVLHSFEKCLRKQKWYLKWKSRREWRTTVQMRGVVVVKAVLLLMLTAGPTARKCRLRVHLPHLTAIAVCATIRQLVARVAVICTIVCRCIAFKFADHLMCQLIKYTAGHLLYHLIHLPVLELLVELDDHIEAELELGGVCCCGGWW